MRYANWQNFMFLSANTCVITCNQVLVPYRFLYYVQAKYVDPEKALEAKERGNAAFRAGQWAKAIEEYEEVSVVGGLIAQRATVLHAAGAHDVRWGF